MASPPAKMDTALACTAEPLPPKKWGAGFWSTARAPAKARPLPSNCQSRNRTDMANPNSNPDRRLLIIDDNHSIHDDFRKILGPTSSGRQRLEAVEAGFYGDRPAAATRPGFEIVSAYQGEEGFNCVREAAGIGRHFCVA